MQKHSAKQLAADAMLAAMCTVLGYVSIDMGNMMITFQTLPILVGALLFGAWDGMAVGLIGNLLYQLLRYGVSATTLLWILPYGVYGLLLGLFAARRGFRFSARQLIPAAVLGELLITVLNTGVIYADSRIYGYYSAAFVFGTLVPRIALSAVKGAVFAAVLPPLLQTVRRALRLPDAA